MESVKTPYVGQLDRKIKIFGTISTQNSIGEEESVKSLICEPWASMNEVSGGEEVEGKILHRTTRKFVVRYRKEIKQLSNKLILEYDGVEYNVTHVKELGRKSFLELQVVDYE